MRQWNCVVDRDFDYVRNVSLVFNGHAGRTSADHDGKHYKYLHDACIEFDNNVLRGVR